MSTAMLYVVLVCTVAVGLGTALAAEGAPAGPVALLKTGFEDGLKSWRRQGEAEFALDRQERRTGGQSARITVRAGTKLQYQQLQYDIQDVAPGDVLRATVWVRTRGITTSPGAYFVLEFLDMAGRRLACDHSKTGADNGRKGWEELSVSSTARPETDRVRVGLILHAHGTAWFDEMEVVCTDRSARRPELTGPREVVIHTGDVVHPRFGGVGFHVFHHTHDITKDHLEQVVAKRWRELNPSFARLNDSWKWDRVMLDKVAAHVLRLKETGTEIYFATWDPEDTKPGAERAAYAGRVVDNLEYLVRRKGATNIRYYCMTNELSLGGWGKLRRDLPKFRDYHREIFKALRARRLDIKLLASDASPIGSWHTIEWATENMDDITGVYGGHHYINRRHPTDERFYPWFLSQMKRGSRMASKMNKDFILGEFGCKQDGRRINGVKMDACIYWGTPVEPWVGIQLAEATIAALNGGIYALGNWTFMDFPDGYHATYANKWGMFKWSGDDYSTRPHYYAYGLLTKFFRGPSTVFRVECDDTRVRAAAIRHHEGGTYSIAVVNRSKDAVDLAVALRGKRLTAEFRKYVYDPENPPLHPFGDLQEPEGEVSMKAGRLADRVGGGSLVVYTTAYDERPPAPVKGLSVGAGGRLRWRANTEPDLCYYRIYRSDRPGFAPTVGTQIGTTVATQFTDRTAPARGGRHYKVLAVDQSGNVSEPAVR